MSDSSENREFTITLTEEAYKFYSLMAKHSYRSIDTVLTNTLHDIPQIVWKRGREGTTLSDIEEAYEHNSSE